MEICYILFFIRSNETLDSRWWWLLAPLGPESHSEEPERPTETLSGDEETAGEEEDPDHAMSLEQLEKRQALWEDTVKNWSQEIVQNRQCCKTREVVGTRSMLSLENMWVSLPGVATQSQANAHGLCRHREPYGSPQFMLLLAIMVKEASFSVVLMTAG